MPSLRVLLRSRLTDGLTVLAIVLVLDHLQELLLLVPAYRQLYRVFPFYIPEGGKSILQIGLVVITLKTLCRESIHSALGELGFFAPFWRGVLVGFAAAIVMLAGFAATLPFKGVSDILALNEYHACSGSAVKCL